MIKNQKQASLTREKIKDLKKAKEEFENKENNNSIKYDLGVKSFESLIADLENQLNEYEGFVKGNFHCFQPKSLQEIPKVLIGARLAQKMSQKELAELIGVKEQQIQRYESLDYETASWPRIFEISIALGLKFLFEKIIIINEHNEEIFELPKDVSKEQLKEFERKTKLKGSLIIQ